MRALTAEMAQRAPRTAAIVQKVPRTPAPARLHRAAAAAPQAPLLGKAPSFSSAESCGLLADVVRAARTGLLHEAAPWLSPEIHCRLTCVITWRRFWG